MIPRILKNWVKLKILSLNLTRNRSVSFFEYTLFNRQCNSLCWLYYCLPKISKLFNSGFIQMFRLRIEIDSTYWPVRVFGMLCNSNDFAVIRINNRKGSCCWRARNEMHVDTRSNLYFQSGTRQIQISSFETLLVSKFHRIFSRTSFNNRNNNFYQTPCFPDIQYSLVSQFLQKHLEQTLKSNFTRRI